MNTATLPLSAANANPGGSRHADFRADALIILRNQTDRSPGPVIRCGMPAPEPVTRAVIYARTSGCSADEPSLFQQIAACRAYIAAQGWQEAGVCTDRNVTGLSQHRPGYRRMMTGEGRSWDMIVAADPWRLFANMDDVRTQVIVLEVMGVGLHTVADGELKPKRRAVPLAAPNAPG